jgi:hypothetical protein
VVDEFSALLKIYGIIKVRGDRYAGKWPRDRFRDRGIGYETAEKPKSDLYRDLLPLINARRIELLDERKLATQLCGLERRATRAGRDSIDHAPNGHDDVCNAEAGCASLLAAESHYWRGNMAWVSDGPAEALLAEPPLNPRRSLWGHPELGGVARWLSR